MNRPPELVLEGFSFSVANGLVYIDSDGDALGTLTRTDAAALKNWLETIMPELPVFL